MKIGIVVLARLTSVRFPNKVFASLTGKKVLDWVVDEVSTLGYPVIITIPENARNDALYDYALSSNLLFFRGYEHDVLDRVYNCAREYNLDVIIRVNGENPLIKAQDIQDNLDKFLKEKRFIYGNHSWIFSFEMLEEAWENEYNANGREEPCRYFFNSIDYDTDIERLEKMLSGWSRSKHNKIQSSQASPKIQRHHY